MMVLSKAIKKTERHNDAIIMPSFAPVGYSGSSESLSRASISLTGLDSMTFFSARPFEALLSVDGVREGVTGVPFSTSVEEVFWLDGRPSGVEEVPFELLAGLERERVGNFMVGVWGEG